MNDGIADLPVKDSRVLLHRYDGTLIIGAWTLHDIVAQPGCVEHVFKYIVRLVGHTARRKGVRHINLVARAGWGEAILPVGGRRL